MTKKNKPEEKAGSPLVEKDMLNRLPVDKTGEPIISEEDPDILPIPDEELETGPPYEPAPPAEGP